MLAIATVENLCCLVVMRRLVVLIRMDVSMPLILVMVAGWEQVLCQALLLSRCGLPLLPSHYSILGSNRVGSQVVLPWLVLVRCDAVVFVSSF